MLGGFVKTIESAAKKATGTVSGFREVLETQPQLSPFQYPPIIQQAIPIVEQFGVRVPSPDELTKLANKELDRILGGVRSKVSKQLDEAERLLGILDKGIGEGKEALKKLDWLL